MMPAQNTTDQSNLAILVMCMQAFVPNRAAFYSVQETCKRKNLRKKA